MSNRLILLTGPSGVGKTTIAHLLLKEIPELERLVTFTTRLPRPQEQNGVDYHFVTKEQFQKKIEAGDFFEHANVYGNFYGNCRKELQKLWDKGKAALMVLDIQGVKAIEKNIPEAISVFIKPDTMDNLEDRIRRRPMSDEAFEKRWQTARAEMAQESVCDHSIVNAENQLNQAVQAVREIVK